MRGIPPWGKRRARAQVAGIAARTVPGIVRGAFPTECAVAQLWWGPFAAGSAAGEGRGEGFPRPTEDDGADRGAMRGIPPWGKRRARAQVAGIAARTVPGIVRGAFPTECAVAQLWWGPFAARERRGGGAWGGVSPPHGRRWRGSRSDARYPPVGEAARTRTSRRNRCPYRSGNRAGCFSDGVCGGATLVGSIRGAERRGGGAWGGVSPPHGRRWRGSRSDARYPPVGSAAHAHKSPESPPVPFRESCGVLFRRSVRWRNSGAVHSRRGAPRGRGVGRGFPAPRKTMARIAERCAVSPRGGSGAHAHKSPESPPVPFRESCGVLFRRSVRWRNSGAVHSRRGAPRGRGVGRGFPAPRKTMARIAERCAVSPRGGSGAHAHKSPESPPVPFRESCGVLSPRGLTSCAVPPAGKTVPQDRGPTDLPRRGPCPERIDCSGVSWPPFRRIPGSTRTPRRG